MSDNDKNHLWKRLLWIVLSVLGLFTVAMFLGTKYDVYAENVSLSAFLRMTRGVPYLSDLHEVPLFINQYSPYFFWFLGPFLKLFGIQSVEGVVFLSRIYVFLASLVTGVMLLSFLKKELAGTLTSVFGLLSLCWVVFFMPGFLGSIRPDHFAVMCEIAAFVLFWKGTFRERSVKWILLAGLLAGVALVFKPNNVGTFAAIGFFLLIRKEWKRAFVFSSLLIVVFVGLSLLAQDVLGARFVENMLASIQNDFASSLSGIYEVVVRIVEDILLAKVVFLLLVVIGLYEHRKTNREQAFFLTLVLGFNFLFASLGQFKAGAWVNYYYSFFLFGAIPVTHAMLALFSSETPLVLRRSMTWAVAGVICLQALLVVLFSARTLVRIPSYPWSEVVQHVEANYAEGPVFADSSAGLLHFHDRILFGPLTHVFYDLSPKIKPTLQEFRGRVHAHHYKVAVIAGDTCHKWIPFRIFSFAKLNHLTHLAHQNKKICVFTEKPAPQ